MAHDDSMSWQRQNMKKTGPQSLSCGQMHPKLGGKQVQYFADGGEAELKAEGLAATEGDKVGFFERLKAGNIDEPGSEAYNRWGAGYAKGMRESEAETNRLRSKADELSQSDSPESAPPIKAVAEPKRAEPAQAKAAEPKDYGSSAARDYTPPIKKTAARPIKPARKITADAMDMPNVMSNETPEMSVGQGKYKAPQAPIENEVGVRNPRTGRSMTNVTKTLVDLGILSDKPMPARMSDTIKYPAHNIRKPKSDDDEKPLINPRTGRPW